MARTAKTSLTKPAGKKTGTGSGQAGRGTTVKTATRATGKPAGGTAKGSVATAKRAAAAAPTRARPASKDELRAQLEKLTAANTTLRAKNRELGRTAKEAGARLEALEARLAELQAEATARGSPAQPDAPRGTARGTRPARRKRERDDLDPGDAVPPGIAVQEPEPLNEHDEAVLENLEHLGEET